MQSSLPKNELIIGPDYASDLIDRIDECKSEILILMFDWRWYEQDFSCEVSLINHALVRAVRRGVKVRAITNLDTISKHLNAVGVESQVWTGARIMHAKTIVLDRWVIVLGSHNLTQNAMTLNIEVSVAFADSILAEKLATYFDSLWR